MYAAILAGGVGSRLWPRSRQSHPKQFTDIVGSGQTLIQTTAERMDGLVDPGQIYVVTGARYVALAAAQLPEVPPANILAEPEGRNTAPAVGLVCLHLLRQDPDALVAILPADHLILHVEAFQAALRQAEKAAQAGYLVTLGIEPSFPHTGYGYIQRAGTLEIPGPLPVYAVERFLEKPNAATAQAFIDSGGYYWNSGIFCSRADRLMGEMARQLPQLYGALQQIGQAIDTAQAQAVLAATWAGLTSISLDYGIMEQAEGVAMVPLNAAWNDMGSWDALDQVLTPDAQGNILAQGQLMAVESHHNIVYGSDRLIAMVGIDDLVVVDTGDALLIGHKTQMQKVKTVVEQLSNGSDESLV